MKYEYCEDCYFYENDPGMCDFCEEGDQFEDAEGDDDAYDRLLEMSKPPKRMIPILPISPVEIEDDEPELLAA